MVSIQLSQARALASLVAVSVVLTGCSMFGHGRDSSSPAPAPTRTSGVNADSAQTAPQEELTATEAAIETAPAPAQSASRGPDASIIRPDAPKTYTVKPGDTLSKISRQFYGNAHEYMRIFYANRDKLHDPDKIQVGQQLVIPPDNA